MSGMINFDEMSREDVFTSAERLCKSELIPASDRGKPANIVLKWQYGYEVGLSPMASLQGIAVINGRPSLWGDALLGLARSHPGFQDIEETFDEATMTARCVVTRRGQTPVVSVFSKKDAEVAGISNGNVHKKYPKRMLQMRARGFALRDAFADKFSGLISAEEAIDYPPEKPEVRVEKVIKADFSSKADMLSAQIDIINNREEDKEKPAESLISRERKMEIVKEAVKERQEAVEIQDFDTDGVIEGLDIGLESGITISPASVPTPEYKPDKVKSHPVMDEIKSSMGIK